MQSFRRTSILFSVAAAACLVIAASATAVVATCRRGVQVVTGYVVAGLALFTAPDPLLPAVPHARTGLTARERHDLAESPIARSVVRGRWLACPST